MRCLIVDDNPLARVVLRHFLSEIAFTEIVGECESAIDAYNLLHQIRADVILLDVELPGMSGLELIQSLQEKPIIILVTSKEEYAIEGFNLQVADYLIKPVTFPRLLQSLQRAAKMLPNMLQTGAATPETEYLFVKNNNALVRLALTEVLFISALGDYVNIVTQSKKFTTHTTLKSVEERLPVDKFVRVHRSHIVNIRQIERIEDSTLVIGGITLPVSETYRPELIKRLNVL